ncbi:uncharacterized protein METZ01_LOCUS391485, partial [marine metagenome]
QLEREGINFLHLREPGDTGTGEKIREWLRTSSELDGYSELFLLSASRRALVKNKIIPALTNGQVVVLDRYIYSTLAYQGFGRGINIQQINYVNMMATEGLSPDITFLLDINPKNSFQRKPKGTLDRWELENIDFHKKVRNGYLKISGEDTNLWRVINADKPKESISEEVWEIVRSHLRRKLFSD